MTSTTGYGSANNSAAQPPLVTQYCNGSRVPPTCSAQDGCAGPHGYGVPPGIVDASTPNPVFTLTPSATVDEGNNWINVSWGPLSLSDDSVTGGANGNYGGGNPLGNYALTRAINTIPISQPHPPTDFFGNARPEALPAGDNRFDPGAVEFASGARPAPPTLVGIAPATGTAPAPLKSGLTPDVVPVTLTGTNLAGARVKVSSSDIRIGRLTVDATGTQISTTFFISSSAIPGATTVTVTTPGGTSNGVTFTVEAPSGTLSFTSATNGTLSNDLGIPHLTFTTPTPRAPVTSVVTITNTGTGPLQITQEAITVDSTDFTLAGTTCSLTTPLAPNGTCTVSITRPAAHKLGGFSATNGGTTPDGFLGLIAP
ncbi:MAG: hypothetical protein JO270_03110 [Acidobacteriaceae bacterium]|nr:hypothetical protein [Acidobacteriaceae bacterium]